MSKAELKKIQSNIILGILCLICITIGNNIIGSFGTTCLAFTVCMFLSVYAVLISWIPDYMTKMVRFRVLKEQYKNISVVLRTMVIWAVFIGAVGTGILLFAANVLKNNPGIYLSVSYLIVNRIAFLFLPISLYLVCIGYLRGIGIHTITSVILIIPTALGIPVTAAFAKAGIQKGEKIAAILHNPDLVGVYGAIGFINGLYLVLAVCFTTTLAVLFIKKYKYPKNKDGMRRTEDANDILLPIFANTSADSFMKYSLYGTLFWGFLFFLQNLQKPELEASLKNQFACEVGEYFGNFMVIIALETCVILLSMLRITASHLNSLKRDDKKNLRHSLSGMILGPFLTSLFFMAFNIGSAISITKLFFGKDNKELIAFLQLGSALPLFMAFALLITLLLRETNKKKNILLFYLIGFLVFIITTLLSMKILGVNAYPILIGSYAFYITLSLLGGFKYFGRFSYVPEWVRMIAMPIVVQALTTLCIYFINKALYQATNALLAFTLSFVLGYVIYTLVLIFMRCIQESDTDVIPLGGMKRSIGNLLRIMV